MSLPIRFAGLVAASVLASVASSPALLAQELLVQGPELPGAESPTEPLGWFVMVRPPATQTEALAELRDARMAFAQAERTDKTSLTPLRDAFEARIQGLTTRAQAATSAARAHAEALGLETQGGGWLVPGFVIKEADPKTRATLSHRADVLDIQPVTWKLPQIGTAVDANHHDAVGAHALSAGGVALTGTGVEIAVLDSGIDMDMNGTGRPHKAFFVNGDPTNMSGGGINGSRVLTSATAPSSMYFPPAAPEDIHGHGTRVTSAIAAAKWSNGLDVADSVAFSASLHNIKISDDNFPGAPASTIVMKAALEAALSNPAIRVANLSYDGDPQENSFLEIAIDKVVNAGLFVTLSAGNHGSDLSFAHGAFNSMVVGGSYEFSPFPYFTSAIGPLDPFGTSPRRYPDLLANGNGVSTAKLDDENKYTVATGTSIAAGFVSGAAALCFQSDPALTPTEVKALLLEHTWDNAGGDPNAGGLGYLRIKEAVQAALAGDVRGGDLAPDGSIKFFVDLTAGTEARYTLAFERTVIGSFIEEMAGDFDFDLEVLDPNGVLVASSATDFDSVEKVIFTPSLTGTYEVLIHEPNPLTAAYATRHFALAGPGLGCGAGGVQVASISPAETPAVIAPGTTNFVFLTGCGMDTVTDVRIGGHQVPFAVTGPEGLFFDLANTPAFGVVTMDLTTPAGTTTAPLDIVAVDPLVFGPAFSPVVASSTITFASKPGDLHILTASPDLIGTPVPGLFNLGIGNGFQSLFQVHLGAVPAGQAFGTWSYIPWGLSGQTFYVQSIVVDPANPAPPYAVSNIHMTTVGI